jgi:hypothetical protein
VIVTKGSTLSERQLTHPLHVDPPLPGVFHSFQQLRANLKQKFPPTAALITVVEPSKNFSAPLS